MTSQRVRYLYRLKPDAGPEYDQLHNDVPMKLLELISAAGISNYTIWRHEDIVVCEFDTVLGFEKSAAILDASPVQAHWTAKLGHLFQQIDDGGAPLWLKEVFRFDGEQD